jgi:spermidine synthase
LLYFRAKHPDRHVGVIGLGAGTLAAYGRKGQEFTFYEIDPAVERAARSYFTYLERSPATCRVVLGDGRQSLEREPDGKFGLLIFDAFSSDAVPVHLITEEAVRLYLDKLMPDGLLVMNLSNNYLDLEPVVAALARSCGLQVIVQLDTRKTPQEAFLGKADSHWAVLARSRSHFGPLTRDPRWRAPRSRDGLRAWTDDYSNLFDVLNWN